MLLQDVCGCSIAWMSPSRPVMHSASGIFSMMQADAYMCIHICKLQLSVSLLLQQVRRQNGAPSPQRGSAAASNTGCVYLSSFVKDIGSVIITAVWRSNRAILPKRRPVAAGGAGRHADCAQQDDPHRLLQCHAVRLCRQLVRVMHNSE